MTDHLGNEFKSEREMCRYWGVTVNAVRARRKKGLTLEQCLTKKVKSKNYEVQDHLGNIFINETEMYKYWNLPVHLGQSRKKHGWDLKRILTEPVNSITKGNAVDHLGNEFKNETEMCKFYGINVDTFNNRRKMGLSLEQSLTTKIKPKKYKVQDHLGNKFNSKNDMYRYWNIPVSLGKTRTRQGWDLERILTEPIYDKKIIDPIFNDYCNTTIISKRYNISCETITRRLNKGKFKIERIVEISFFISNRVCTVNQTKYNLTVVKRIQKGKDVFECYIDNEDGTSTFRIMSYDMIDQYCIEQYKKLHNIL